MDVRFKSVISSFYLILLLIAVVSYYFSISDSVFYWLHPDEINPSNFYNVYGFWGCVKSYYLNTTINRVSAGFGLCGMAKTATLFSTPFLGWVFARFIFYTLIPISFAYVLKEICSISLKFSLTIAYLVSAMSLFLISSDIYIMFGLDLAIYAMVTVSFFALVGLFPKALKQTRYFTLFCIFFAINLNGHEIFLTISGFFIPLFAWYSRSSVKLFYNYKLQWLALLKDVFKNKKIWILLTIYILSVLAETLAPGVKIRQSIWPSNGTFFDGLEHMILSIEEMLYYLSKALWFLIIIFFLGILTRWSLKSKKESPYLLLYAFLFFTPLLYLCITGFLLGITPSLWAGSLRADSFLWFEPMLHNKRLLNQGGFAIRQNLFLYLGLFLDFFLLGFFVMSKINRSFAVQVRIWPFTASLFSVVMIVFLLHPDGNGSLKVLSTLFEKNTHSNFHSIQQESSNKPNFFLNQFFPSESTINTLGKSLFFPRRRVVNHELSMINIRASDYLHSNYGKSLSLDVLSPIYDPMIDGYKVAKNGWGKSIFDLYKLSVLPTQQCVSFSDKVKSKFTCHQAFGENHLRDALRNKKILPPLTISLTQPNNIEQTNKLGACEQWSDTLNTGEHYLTTGIFLKKGFHFFILKAKPSKTQLYIYLTAEKVNILLPWLNFSDTAGWSHFGEHKENLVPIFSQQETTSTSEKIKIVIYSPISQKVNLRWQHAYAGGTVYNGKKEITSTICGVKAGEIVNIEPELKSMS